MLQVGGSGSGADSDINSGSDDSGGANSGNCKRHHRSLLTSCPRGPERSLGMTVK